MYRMTDTARNANDSSSFRRRRDRRRRSSSAFRRFQFNWERVEERTLLSTISWAADVSGDWDNPAMWGGAVPGSGDDAVINFSDITVTHTSSASDAVNSLTSQAAIEISGGLLSTASASTIQNAFNVTAAMFATTGDLTVSGLLTLDISGSLSGGGSVDAYGGLLLDGAIPWPPRP
jgi:hypothetical protein